MQMSNEIDTSLDLQATIANLVIVFAIISKNSAENRNTQTFTLPKCLDRQQVRLRKSTLAEFVRTTAYNDPLDSLERLGSCCAHKNLSRVHVRSTLRSQLGDN